MFKKKVKKASKGSPKMPAAKKTGGVMYKASQPTAKGAAKKGKKKAHKKAY